MAKAQGKNLHTRTPQTEVHSVILVEIRAGSGPPRSDTYRYGPKYWAEMNENPAREGKFGGWIRQASPIAQFSSRSKGWMAKILYLAKRSM